MSNGWGADAQACQSKPEAQVNPSQDLVQEPWSAEVGMGTGGRCLWADLLTTEAYGTDLRLLPKDFFYVDSTSPSPSVEESLLRQHQGGKSDVESGRQNTASNLSCPLNIGRGVFVGRGFSSLCIKGAAQRTVKNTGSSPGHQPDLLSPGPSLSSRPLWLLSVLLLSLSEGASLEPLPDSLPLHLASRLFWKCLRLNPDVPIWTSKQRILCTLNHSLKDVLNYGLFQPAFNGRAGKFLHEERLLREYPLNPETPVPYLEFRYKRRVYSQPLLDDKQFAKLHTKVSHGPGGRGGVFWLHGTGRALEAAASPEPHPTVGGRLGWAGLS
ncbi:SH3 and multiple ankyrin repeat domains protein 3-like [Crotalus adamanteus]|uniref:SH3 and multiple ankyrin repeat domains protein 3-like n=1 Tax=Crotalus adamanteus TaxID=8729 RepID=A0AAW1BEZ5_CROAD